MQPERIGRRDYEYKRCGTANVFCGVEPKAGRHFTKTTPTRSSPEFADFLLEIDAPLLFHAVTVLMLAASHRDCNAATEFANFILCAIRLTLPSA